MRKLKGQLDSFRNTLEKNKNPMRAENEKRYLKSPYKFFGISLPFTEKRKLIRWFEFVKNIRYT